MLDSNIHEFGHCVCDFSCDFFQSLGKKLLILKVTQFWNHKFV